MWITTVDGFYSAVALSGDQSKLLIRCRVREDAERLAAKLGLDRSAVIEDKLADYRWRLGHGGEVSKADFASYLAGAVFETNYTSDCKGEMSKPSGTRESDRYAWYSKCWHAGYDVQDEREMAAKLTTVFHSPKKRTKKRR